MPGKIIHALKKAGTSNPVILLDEIDKMSNDFRGDPAAAMLEVLDPGQNKSFGDHYIECEYDLSKVMFIMTANDLGAIPGPLRDRMEIIHIAGYTPDEKMQIAKKYLLPKAVETHGLKNYPVSVTDKVLTSIVRGYTKEAGVRELERLMNTVARKIATEVVTEDIKEGRKFSVTEKNLETYLGPMKFERTDVEQQPQVGLVNGLAWTSVGGELLNIEVVTVPGNGKIQVTGKLGEVMQESAKAALSYVRSISNRLGIDHEWYHKNDIHIHVPEGATPKDGPSAGIAMLTSMVSSFTQKRIKKNIAMTGEITLRGKVLPVGGIKEKILAAKRANIKEIILCKENKRDIEEIKPDYIEGLTFHYVDKMSEVLDIAITNQKVKNAKVLETKK